MSRKEKEISEFSPNFWTPGQNGLPMGPSARLWRVHLLAAEVHVTPGEKSRKQVSQNRKQISEHQRRHHGRPCEKSKRDSKQISKSAKTHFIGKIQLGICLEAVGSCLE